MSHQPSYRPPAAIDAELRVLADRYCEERLTADDVLRLESLLADEALRRAFLARVEVHAGLHWLLRGAAEAVPTLPQVASSSQPASFWRIASGSRWLRASLSIAALLLISLGLWSLFQGGQERQLPTPAPAGGSTWAMLRDGKEMQWSGESASLAARARLGSQPLELASGLAEIEFDSATVVVVEGPARFAIVDALGMKLDYGRVAVRMSPGKSGFVVDCPVVRVLDEGTEFGVEVAAAGSTIVQVYEGQVAANLKQASDDRQRRLTAGQSLEVTDLGRDARPTDFVEERFVRQLPQNSAFPSNEPQHEIVYAPRAPGLVRIDGDLSDWDLRRQFRSQCRGEYGASYYLEAAVMHDDEHLYVGAHVGDPAPLVNQYLPEDQPGFAWRGGGMHLRIAADPSLPWPLEIESEIFQRLYAKRNPTVPVHPQLFGHFMWHCAPRNEACLLRYPELVGGIPQGTVEFEGVRGKFRPDADGRGYVLEYAIPWRELNVSQPPRPGDRWPAVWQLHWSADGHKHLGHLIDVLNPAERENLRKGTRMSLIFHRAVMWGRLEFEGSASEKN